MNDYQDNKKACDVYDACTLINGDDLLLILLPCADEAIDAVRSSCRETGALPHLIREWGTLKYQLEDGRTQADSPFEKVGAALTELLGAVDQQIAELTAKRANLAQVADRSQLRTQFSAGASGKQLKLVWEATLNCDTDGLARMVSYAPNAVFGSSPTVYRLLKKLLEQAGLQFATAGSAERCVDGAADGSLTILVNQTTGLQVTYERSQGPNATETYGAAVVQGSIDPQLGRFIKSAGANYDPEAVRAMATTISQKLLDHYLGNNDNRQ